ncbi:MAG: hypothetical protein GXP56_13960 [Deltaproteobacteria bacterium]|nr:hypothetical protein [Deltaproteobacteria bacterium]
MYFLAINKIKQEEVAVNFTAIIKNHIEWTKKEIENGNILQAGKWGKSGGMSIIKALSIDEAERVLRNDPLIQAGLVNYEIDEFYPDKKINF